MIRPGGLFAVDFVVQLQEAVLYGVGKAGQFAAQQADGFGEVAVFVGIEDAAGAFVEALVGEQYVGVFVEVGVFFALAVQPFAEDAQVVHPHYGGVVFFGVLVAQGEFEFFNLGFVRFDCAV